MRSDKRLLRSANTAIITIIPPYISEYNWPFFLLLFFLHHHHLSLSKGFWFFLVLVRRDCRKRSQWKSFYTDKNPSGCYEPWTLSFLLFYLFLSNKVIIITFCACFWVKENQKPKTKAINESGPDSQTQDVHYIKNIILIKF